MIFKVNLGCFMFCLLHIGKLFKEIEDCKIKVIQLKCQEKIKLFFKVEKHQKYSLSPLQR